jgi:hypothetical protein
MNLNLNQLAEMVRGFDSAVIASFTAHTIPKMVVKDRQTGLPNPYLNKVVKVSRINGIIGDFSFNNVVTNQLVREAIDVEKVEPYVAAPRSWGNHVPDSGLVEHKGVLYLRITLPKTLMSQYRIDGVPATDFEKKAIESYLPVRKPTDHGTEKEIQYRDYTLKNIKELRCGGKIYTIVEDGVEAA